MLPVEVFIWIVVFIWLAVVAGLVVSWAQESHTLRPEEPEQSWPTTE